MNKHILRKNVFEIVINMIAATDINTLPIMVLTGSSDRIIN